MGITGTGGRKCERARERAIFRRRYRLSPEKRIKLLYDRRANTDSQFVGTQKGIRVVGTEEQLHSRNVQSLA